MRADLSTVLNDIRARLPISEVVARRVTFDKRKSQPRKGDFWGCCPFHGEKTPSFHCDDRRAIYHCFGCGATGDHVKFVMETEGRSFPEAVEVLAQMAGVTMPAPDPQAATRQQQRLGLAEAVEIAARFFEHCFRTPVGKDARDYAQRRGLTAEAVKEFRIGYAPNERDALKKALLEKGVTEEVAIEAGLLIKPEDGRGSYDRFRGRLMIPIHDERGRVVAFGGRTLDPKGEPKYLNSPETPLFFKGQMLFNWHRARQAAFDAGTVIVTEGYMDVIAVWQAGVRNVVAALGTAFTEDHALRLWKLAPEPTICFDGDKAGISAAHRAIDRVVPLLKSGFSFNFCFLPEGKDPDELIKAGGREAFLKALETQRPLSDVVWDREVDGTDIATPERKAALEARFDKLIAAIADERVRRRYQLTFRSRLSDLFFQLERNRRRATNLQTGSQQRQSGASFAGVQLGSAALLHSDQSTLEKTFLGLCLARPDQLEAHAESVLHLEFTSDAHTGFAHELVRLLAEFDEPQPEDFIRHARPQVRDMLEEIFGSAITDEAGEIARAAGHRLIDRMPILLCDPPEDFVTALYEILIERISLRTLEREIDHELSSIAHDFDEQTEARLLWLGRERVRRREELVRAEQELAERARTIRAHAPPRTGNSAVA